MALIGIDIGSSFIKGSLLDLDRRVLTHVRHVPFPPPLQGLSPGHREYDPRHVVDAVRSLIDGLMAASTDTVDGLIMCSQMHGLVLTTKRGEPRSNLITWQDQRTLQPHPAGQGTYFDVMAQRVNPTQVRQLGNELDPGRPVSFLFWLAEQGLLTDPSLIPASLPDFVLANFCQTQPVTDSTNAAAHGAFNLETGDWHSEVLASLGLDRLRWPELVPHGVVVGTLELGGRDVPCYIPIGDSQCALLGVLLDYGELSLNVATGAQVSLLRPHLEFGDFQTRPNFDGGCLTTIPNVPAGRSLTALVRLLSELAEAQGIALPDPWTYIAQAAAAADPPNLQVDLAFFRSSCGDQGSITAMREEELTIGHLFRASFQNMADNFGVSARRLSPEQPWQRLVFSGGLVQRFPILRTLICEKFGVEHRLSPTSEDTMLGLLVLGLAFTGRVDSIGGAVAELRDFYSVPDGH